MKIRSISWNRGSLSAVESSCSGRVYLRNKPRLRLMAIMRKIVTVEFVNMSFNGLCLILCFDMEQKTRLNPSIADRQCSPEG